MLFGVKTLMVCPSRLKDVGDSTGEPFLRDTAVKTGLWASCSNGNQSFHSAHHYDFTLEVKWKSTSTVNHNLKQVKWSEISLFIWKSNGNQSLSHPKFGWSNVSQEMLRGDEHSWYSWFRLDCPVPTLWSQEHVSSICLRSGNFTLWQSNHGTENPSFIALRCS